MNKISTIDKINKFYAPKARVSRQNSVASRVSAYSHKLPQKPTRYLGGKSWSGKTPTGVTRGNPWRSGFSAETSHQNTGCHMKHYSM